MYVVTYYSYKGGVGRSMALVNTAAILVQQGKRVLMVDFDLEAPGLPSYAAFQCAEESKGLVDYINDYIASNQAPNVSDYISECESGKLWLMSAGDYRSGRYAEKLASIDWQELYSIHSGYLMFEDMKQQWSQFQGRGFDYVLIDSRTGHTDVGGICTRQLPDAVVIMFLPNAQNIQGLKPVVNLIRNDSEKSLRQTSLHFCPSNVPDLDDEEEILRDLLELSKKELSYKEPAATIYHYNSLALLSQVSFVSMRPNSRLTKEYKKLTDSIIAKNLDDEAGARIALEGIRRDYKLARVRLSAKRLAEMSEATDYISRAHGGKPEIAWLLAQVYEAVPSAEDEIAALTVAIDGGYNVERARIMRATRYLQLNDRQHASVDLKEVLASNAQPNLEAIPAIEMLRTIGEGDTWLEALRAAPFLKQLDRSTFGLVIPVLLSDRSALPLAFNLCKSILNDEGSSSAEIAYARNQATLCQIGIGAFSDACNFIASDRTVLLRSASEGVAETFNYAIAEWGATGSPAKDLFLMVLERGRSFRDSRDANFCQCLALAQYVVGEDEEALESLRRARELVPTKGRLFSCWRYLVVPRGTMLADITAMEGVMQSKKPFELPFFSEVRGTVH